MSPDRYLRTFDVLNLLVQRKEGLRLTEIKDALGLPVSSVHNMLQTMVTADAVAMLPEWARQMLRLQRPMLTALPARAATWGMGRTLRWAFRQN